MKYLGNENFDFYKYSNYVCVVVKTNGHYCGYVIIDKSHPIHGKHYTSDNFPDFNVHGGITYSDYLIKNNYAIGFDCNHINDLVEFGGTPKDKDFVLKELVSLVEQVKNYEKNE